MKITAFLLLAACLQVSARGDAQTVTLHEKDASLQKVFREIYRQTGYEFFYNDDLLQEARKVTLDVTNLPLSAVLDLCFRDQPLSFVIQDQSIIVRRKAADVVAVPLDKNPMPGGIHGRVTDSAGAPIEGATVMVKGTKLSAVTDAKGEFHLSGVGENAVLVITHIGYQRQEAALRGRAMIQVRMEIGQTSLADVVVNKGYYSTTARLNTGDVTVVTSKEIGSQPTTNTLLALRGLVPGLYITQQSGMPGSGVQILIQGQNSINNGNDPYYVVDGVPYPQELLPNIGSQLGYSGTGSQKSYGNPFSYLNPGDIESISVLKDADATAIYGSKAANGAIIITTKKGKVGRTTISFNMSDGFGHITKEMPELNTQQYLEMRHEAFRNDGLQPSLANGDYDLLFWDTTRYTDWQKTLIGGTAHYSTYTLSASGGSPNIQYLLSGNYHRQTSVFPDNFSDQSGSLHVNLNSTSENKKLQISLSTEYLFDDNRLPNQDLTTMAVETPPDAPPLYSPDGSINWALNSAGSSTWLNEVNPIAFMFNTYEVKGNNLVSSLNFSYKIVNDLQVKVDFGYNNMTTNEIAEYPLTSLAPDQRPYNYSQSIFQTNLLNSWIIEPQLNYNHHFGKSNVALLAGGTLQRNNSSANGYTGVGYSSDLLLSDISAAANVTANGTFASQYRYAALFGRANYTYDDKYILNLTINRDGSSRFGANNEFHDFVSAGAAWIFSEEKLVKNNIPFLSLGKLRASYGTTGSDQIGDYQFISTYSPLVTTVTYQGTSSLQSNGLVNPYLQWEETRKLSVEMALGFIKDRILINGTYFQNRTSNQLIAYALPSMTGFGQITLNLPADVQNAGWELTINTSNIKTKSFSWTSRLNLSRHENKLLSFPGLANSSYANLYIIGKSITAYRAFHYAGVNDTTGLYQFVSAKGTVTSNPSYPTDATETINLDPKIYGNLYNTVAYKGVGLTFNFSYVNKAAPNYYFGFLSIPGKVSKNQPTYVMDRWQEPGDNKPIQRFSTNSAEVRNAFGYARNSDAYYADLNLVRLESLQLEWHLPAGWVSRAKITSATLFVQAKDLLTLSNFKGLDPETGYESVPPLRVLTFGFNANF